MGDKNPKKKEKKKKVIVKSVVPPTQAVETATAKKPQKPTGKKG